MPVMASRSDFTTIDNTKSEDNYNTWQNLLKGNGFHPSPKFTTGCYIKKVSSLSTDLPELIRNIIPRNEKGEVWILAKRSRDKHCKKDNENGIDTNAENNEHLANLGTFLVCTVVFSRQWSFKCLCLHFATKFQI